ncbi:AraC family transcriptional regulator [Thalassomonas sp. RHCl1]|uniref:AraC family transcriptional regulator n=1 Tax=Thalassomonas sp. RHCl1 TaxID=2995320 RepID=UPI00248BB28C|nr:AraC family transcriptional regulator [Thalassomonas sp. RHCl1]
MLVNFITAKFENNVLLMPDQLKPDTRCKEYQRRINQAMNYISEHATESLSLDDIAQKAYFSKYHFHRIFKAFAGETVAGFTRRIRLEQAANLLYLDKAQSITKIALDYGFSSAQNFTKQFTKHFGESPSFFRQDNNSGASLALIQQSSASSNAKGVTHPMHEDLEVVIKTQPAFQLAYMRFIEPYQSMSTLTYLKTLSDNIGIERLKRTNPVGVAWDNPNITEGAKCRYDLGITLSGDFDIPGNFSVQEFPESLCAVYRCTITDGDLEKPWDDLVIGWLPYSGYVLSGVPAVEVFKQFDLQTPSGHWQLEIYLPVKPI